MNRMYIFRYDPTYPDEGEDKVKLEQHNGKRCLANIGIYQRPTSLVSIFFDDGYENCAFVYELEEVSDGN